MKNPDPNAVIIYTDGACEQNPGPGGWAAIIANGKHRRTISGGYRRTTNNRMELMAAIEGLRTVSGTQQPVQVLSDSKYVTEAVNQGWLNGWARSGFREGKSTRVNADLWIQLRELLGKHSVTFVWIKGHAEHPENEECDRTAVTARQLPDLPTDTGFENPEATNISLGLTLL